MHPLLDQACVAFKRSYSYILVPRFLIIENSRLGLLFRFLQVSMGIFIIWNLLIQEQWLYYGTPYKNMGKG